MGGLREAALTLLLLTSALAVAPSVGALPCDSGPWGVAASAPLQDDAGSGFDAGDAPEEAIELPGHDEYQAFLDPLYRDGRDAEDWYALDIPLLGRGIRFSVSEAYRTVDAPDVAFRMDVFAPGADAPSFTTTSRSGPIDLDAYDAGRWLVRVTVVDPPHAAYVCGTGEPLVGGTGARGATSEAISNHVVYFGCDPVCTWAA